MNNTALRAEAQSASNTHMVFADKEHEKFYFEKLAQARYQDCYHQAHHELLEETRKEIKNMRFFKEVVEVNTEEYEIIHDYDKALENAR